MSDVAEPILEEPAVTIFDTARLEHGGKPTLRFVTCGSVDDGKSTLVGRLLYDSKMLLDDQLAALASESKVAGTTDGDLDFAIRLAAYAAAVALATPGDISYFGPEDLAAFHADAVGRLFR